MFGWTKTKQHAWFIVLVTIIIGIIMNAVRGSDLLNAVVSLMVGLSIASISLIISRDHSFTFYDLVSPLLSYKKVLKFFVLAVLFAVPILVLVSPFVLGVYSRNPMVTISGLLLLVPLVYFTVRLKFFPFIVLEHENASINDLVLMSYKLTAHHFLPVFLFLLSASLLNILGILLFGIGLLVTVPVTLFATAHMYDRLKEHTV